METIDVGRSEFLAATNLHSKGDVAAAIAGYERAAKRGYKGNRLPELLGLAYIQLNAYAEAVRWLERALTKNSASHSICSSLGLSLLNIKKYQEADYYFSMALEINPNCEMSIKGRACSRLHRRLYKEAISDFAIAIKINPNDYECLVNIGDAYRHINDDQNAIRSYEAAKVQSAGRTDADIGLGRVHFKQNQFELASEHFRAVIATDKNNSLACYEYGNCLIEFKKLKKAILWLTRAAKRSKDSDTCYAAGLKLQELRRFKESIRAYKNSISLNCRNADAYINIASAYRSIFDYESAISMLNNALLLEPDSFIAQKNKANCYRDIKRLNEACVAYRHAYELKPTHDFLLGTLAHAEALGCQWEHTAERVERLTSEIEGGQAASPPFPLFGLLDSPELQRRAAELYSNQLYSTVASTPLERYERRRGDRIRVGYFSADLHAHATSFLISELLELHNREQFEVFAYSFGHGPKDAMFERIKKAVDCFFDVRDWSDEEICQHAREQKIDIAIDLKGYTQDSRPGIFARRCAPVQINYLGFPGTMGMPSIDYIIADRIVIPECEREHYSEKVLYMPSCYQVNDSKRKISNRTFTRQEFGLPDGAFVFCCFNNNYKILPEIFDIWMRLLNRVPGSVLWLYKDNDTAAKNLQIEAARRGIDSSRLIFAERMPLDEHLARHQLADLFLDTFPCNAHTTASDALWAGLPLITRAGRSFSSRVAASLLTAMDLAELIVYDDAKYEELAIRLASEPNQLKKIQSKIHTQKKLSSLFDTRKYVRDIEDLLSYTLEDNSPKNFSHSPMH